MEQNRDQNNSCLWGRKRQTERCASLQVRHSYKFKFLKTALANIPSPKEATSVSTKVLSMVLPMVLPMVLLVVPCCSWGNGVGVRPVFGTRCGRCGQRFPAPQDTCCGCWEWPGMFCSPRPLKSWLRSV